MFGHRTIKGLRLRHYYYYYYWIVAALVVGLFALVILAGTLSFLGASPRAEQSPSFDASATSSTALQEEASSKAVGASLDKDVNNDGTLDGVVDPLPLSVVQIVGVYGALSLVALLMPLANRPYLLAVYKLPKLGSIYYSPLERPG